MVIIVLASSAIAVALTYTASAHQRWLHRPLPAFPARVTAALAAIVALKGWSELFGPAAGAFVWLTTVLLAAILLMFAALLRRIY